MPLETELRAAHARARAAFPGVTLEVGAFVAHVAKKAAAPAGLDLDALYLTCAASLGDAPAIALIESQYFTKAKAALASLKAQGTVADDALSTIRERLFVKKKIADYAGRGDLSRWIRTAAMRAAMDLLEPA